MVGQAHRPLLVLGLAGLLASLPTRVIAADPVFEVESEVYAGQSHGEWTCGPKGVARYGGVGARARYSERPPAAEDGAGFHASLGASGEYEVVSGGPPDNFMVGIGSVLGYRERYAGFSAGFLAYQGYDNATRRTPDWSTFPILELDFGAEEAGLTWPIGFGPPLVSTYRRPAVIYTGPRFTWKRSRLEVLAGFYRSGPASLATAQLRVDESLQFRLSKRFWLGPHAAIAVGEPIDGEVGLGVTLDY